MGDSILRKTDRTLSKGEDVVCLPGARIEHVTERVENVLGHGEVSKRDCIIMGDFNHGHIQWTSLQSIAGERIKSFSI